MQDFPVLCPSQESYSLAINVDAHVLSEHAQFLSRGRKRPGLKTLSAYGAGFCAYGAREFAPKTDDGAFLQVHCTVHKIQDTWTCDIPYSCITRQTDNSRDATPLSFASVCSPYLFPPSYSTCNGLETTLIVCLWSVVCRLCVPTRPAVHSLPKARGRGTAHNRCRRRVGDNIDAR